MNIYGILEIVIIISRIAALASKEAFVTG